MAKFAVPMLRKKPPEPFKDYHTDHAIDLVGYLPFDRHPFTGGSLPETDPKATAAGLFGLSRLLYFTNGVTGIMPMNDGSKQYFRAAPSAGALYPTEIYIAVRDLPELADGIYNYQVRDHSLAPVWEGSFWERLSAATCANGALEQANVAILFTGCWDRGTWRYRDRAYRRALLDTGHVYGNLAIMGPACGYGVFPIGGFIDPAINGLLFVDDEQEGALMLAALPRLDSLDLSAAARGGTVLPSPRDQHQSDMQNEGEGLLQQLHRTAYVTEAETCFIALGGERDDRDEGLDDADEIISLDHEAVSFDNHGELERLILARRSCRRFAPGPIDTDDLGALFSYAYQPSLPLREDRIHEAVRQMFDPTLLDTYVIVNRSDDMQPGIYHYAPISHQLRQIRDGDQIDASRHICLGQDLGGDASLLVIHTANLKNAIERYGDRAYRYLHLDAGHIGERLNLAAEVRDLGASGIGGFYDDDVIRLLGLSDDHAVIYITTLGHTPDQTP